MQRLFLTLVGLACLAAVSAVKIIPGKAFDRFITIWLENQVCFLRPAVLGRLLPHR